MQEIDAVEKQMGMEEPPTCYVEAYLQEMHRRQQAGIDLGERTLIACSKCAKTQVRDVEEKFLRRELHAQAAPVGSG